MNHRIAAYCLGALICWQIPVWCCAQDRAVTTEEPEQPRVAAVDPHESATPSDATTGEMDALSIDADRFRGSDRDKLNAVLRFARHSLARIERDIRDYTCVIVKRERVNNRLGTHQYLLAKIRNAHPPASKTDEGGGAGTPFSVYLKFLPPTHSRIRGREVIYVDGRNHGDLIARRGGRRSPNMTLQLAPKSPLAMEGNRYPITEIGVVNLTRRLIAVLEEEQQRDNAKVKVYHDAKLYGRPCVHFELTHRTKLPESRYYKARVLVDTEWKIPVYYAAYDWPANEGDKPPMLEEYAYTRVKLNPGLTDRDFDVENPDYQFQTLDELPPGELPPDEPDESDQLAPQRSDDPGNDNSTDARAGSNNSTESANKGSPPTGPTQDVPAGTGPATRDGVRADRRGPGA